VTIFGAAGGVDHEHRPHGVDAVHGRRERGDWIIGMWKSALTLAKEIGSAALEIEKSQALLSKYMKAVEAIAKKGKAAAKANEYGAAFVKQFLGEAQPNIKGCGSQLETIIQKLTGVEIKSHDCGKVFEHHPGAAGQAARRLHEGSECPAGQESEQGRSGAGEADRSTAG